MVKTVDRLLDSTLDSVDSAEELVVEIAEQSGFPGDDLHKVGMAVRESMANAVVHGNRYNAHKKVRIRVSGSPERLEISVSDQGNGFDCECLPDPLQETNLLRQSGRGIFLIRAFMDEFHVRRLEPSGTEVLMVKYGAAPSKAT